MNVLVIGSGAREHVFCWKLLQSPKLTRLYIAPGNAGTSQICENVNLNINNFKDIEQFSINNHIKIIIVGPEDPLVNGIVDYFENKNSDIKIIGPNKYSSQLEGSKLFTKKFLERNNIPTAKYKEFNINNIKECSKYFDDSKPPYVLKADGLAAGKGVVIIDNKDDAIQELNEMIINKKFGASSEVVIIEEFLSGIELSVFALIDGENYIIFPEAKDYKKVGEADTGSNTGGMGAISPVSFYNIEFSDKVVESIIQPTIDGLIKEEFNYKGFLFFGLIKVDDEPYVIEFNVRMGDPETQVVIPRIKNDFLELMIACADRKLDDITLQIDDNYFTNVVLVAGDYPAEYNKGDEINGLNQITDSIVFHAGTSIIDNRIVTNGGRVLSIVSKSKIMKESLEISYKNIKKINYKSMKYRRDIGFDL